MKETILITGATGTVGRELIKNLLSNNICVRIAVRSERGAAEYRDCGCPIVHFDYKKKESYKEAFEGISGFFLSAPLAYSRLDELVLPAIECAKEMGVVHIVSLGDIGVELDNETPLSILEKCVQCCGLQYTILKPNLLMQNLLAISGKSIKDASTIYLPAADAKISYVDARDVAEAAGVALTDISHRNKVYTLTGKEAVSHLEIASILSMITGKTITYRPITHNKMFDDLVSQGWSQEVAQLMVGRYEIARHGWCRQILPDLSSLIEREPCSFEQFAWDYKDYWI